MLRVNSVIKEILADEVERLSDSRLEMVSVTGVDTAPNLRSATVYVDVLDSDKRQPALDALRVSAIRLQKAIGSQARLKYTPTLEFAVDPAVTGGERIDAILRSIGDQKGGEDD